ncbi:hypothetical protein LJC23_04825 [Desulfovibrio sp. OttesenSCG-928-I05]|nr:hypothetical protein [Desulfovibrio sp. OttesenSCG-928-I05]
MSGMINAIAASGDFSNIRDMLHQIREAASATTETALGASCVAAAASSSAIVPADSPNASPVAPENAGQQAQPVSGYSRSSSSLMAGNFYNSNYEKSEYTQASLAGFASESTFGNKLNSTLNAVISSVDYERLVREARSPNARIGGLEALAAIRARRATGAVVDEEVHEKSKEHLKKSKEHIEEAATEALTPESMQALDASPAPEPVDIAPDPGLSNDSASLPPAASPGSAASLASPLGASAPRLDIIV